MAEDRNASHFRALERLCTEQAALTTDGRTRGELLAMAAEHRKQAEQLEREQPESD